MFFMFSLSAAVAMIFMVFVTRKSPIETKLSVVLFLTLAIFKETRAPSFESIDQLLLPSIVRIGLGSVLSADKDMLLFSFSARSNFLWVLMSYLALRWSRLDDAPRYTYYAILPILSLVHSSQGALVVAMIFLTDLFSRPRVLLNWQVPAAYALALLLCLSGGFARSPLILLALLVAGLCLSAFSLFIVVSNHGRLKSLRQPFERLTRRVWEIRFPLSIGVDGALITLSGIFILVVFTTISGFPASTQLNAWQSGIMSQRLGAILAVVIPQAFVFTSVYLIGARLGKLRDGVSLVLASICVVGVPLYLAVGGELVRPLNIVDRLVAEVQQTYDSLPNTATFYKNNELHRIWLSITKSSLIREDATVEVGS
jgi:hypothetical protein